MGHMNKRDQLPLITLAYGACAILAVSTTVLILTQIFSHISKL